MKVTLPKISKNRVFAPVIAGAAALGYNIAVSSKKHKNNNIEPTLTSKASSEILENQFIAANRINKINETKFNPNNKIYVLSGSSGVGKDTILRAFLQKHPEYILSVSYTTRPIRPNEVNGKDYYFISEEEFNQGIENDEFLEWGEFSGNRYGTKKQSVKDSITNNNKVIFKLDTVGALKVKRMMPEATLIFIAPPSLEELEARLRGRNTESEESIRKRMGVIKSEMENSKQFDYIIVNDKVDNAVHSLENILM